MKRTALACAYGKNCFHMIMTILLCTLILPDTGNAEQNENPVLQNTLTSLAASTLHLQQDTLLFQGSSSPDWTGDLTALKINMDTGEIIGEKWRAAKNLDTRNMRIDPRQIFTLHDIGNYGILFNYDNLSEEQKSRINDPEGNISGTDLVNYITRGSLLGAIVNSQPVYHDNIVYIGANDGMLHAFDAQTGKEQFAYVPNILFENLPLLARDDFSYGYYVDATPFVRHISDGSEKPWTALVGGLGKGGKGYYCLDVTHAKSMTGTTADAMDLVKWEFTDDEDLGYTTGCPLIVKTRAGWVAIFGNGHDSSREEAVFYILREIDQSNPPALKFHTGVKESNGIVADLTAIDANSDSYADFVYAGDLHGNIWKIDIRDEDYRKWDFAYKSGSVPQPFFTAKSRQGNAQPITTAIDVMDHCLADRAGYILLFGTGRKENLSGAETTNHQTVYGLWDWQEEWERMGKNKKAGQDKYFGAFTRPRLSALDSHPVKSPPFHKIRELTLLKQSVQESIISEEEQWLIMTNYPINWWHPKTGNGNHVGWYFDLPHPGEQIIHNPTFRNRTAVIISVIPQKTPSGTGSSALYMLDACTGGESFQAQIDVNRDGGVSNVDMIIDSTDQNRRPGGMIIDAPSSLPFILSRLLYIPGLEPNDPQIIPVREQRSGATYWLIPDYGW